MLALSYMCFLQLLWDVEDPNLFIAVNSNGVLWAYQFVQQSVSGQKLELLCKTVLLKGHTPVVLAGGRVSLRMKSGAMDQWILESHKALYEQGDSAKHLQRRCVATTLICYVCLFWQLACWLAWLPTRVWPWEHTPHHLRAQAYPSVGTERSCI